MIKPVTIAENIVNSGKALIKSASETAENISEESATLPHAGGELLQAYYKINTKKLFENFADFVTSFKAKLAEYKDDIPEELYSRLEKHTDLKDFSLQKIISDYYSGLNECKTLNEVRELYPDIKIPALNMRDEIAEFIKGTVSKDFCNQVAKLKTKEEKQHLINEYFEKNISKQVEKWEIYPEFKAIQDNIVQEIVEGKFTGKLDHAPKYPLFNHKMPLKYRLLRTQDSETAIIEILREHYVKGKNLTDINIKTHDGLDLNAKRLQATMPISEMEKHFRTFIRFNELQAEHFRKLSTLDEHQINSAIMTQTWKSSRLRADLGNETAYKKDWSLVKPVWQKTMFPDQTFYPTDKLIDTYLLGLFKNGKTELVNNNPISKYQETPFLDKTKIMLLKRLYKGSKDLELDKNILKSEKYKNFKSQFNTEEMKKSIEEIEEHYKNAFFKYFWTDERKLRFTNALHRNKELADKNIKISEDILVKAMDNVFIEN